MSEPTDRPTDGAPVPQPTEPTVAELQRIRLWRSRFRSEAPDRQDVRRVRVTVTVEEIADTERGYTSD